MASDAELARASVYTYKGHLQDSDKTFDELLKENLYLSGMLKQKEAQMQEAERRWRQQFNDALKKATSEFEEESEYLQPEVLPKVIATESPNVGDMQRVKSSNEVDTAILCQHIIPLTPIEYRHQ